LNGAYDPLFLSIIKKIYGDRQSVSIVTQVRGWKLGKTSFGFSLTEILKDLGLAQMFASNTETDCYPLIDDFDNFNAWRKSNRVRKAYIYDEAAVASQKRRAMSNINITWVSKIPQLSKEGGCHLIVITQEKKITESQFYNETFLRGIWTKLSYKTVEFQNKNWFDENPRFYNIPMTKVKFDIDQTADFKMHGEVKKDTVKLEEYELGERISILLTAGWKRKDIEAKEGIHPFEYERARDTYLKNKYSHITIPNKPDKNSQLTGPSVGGLETTNVREKA
jgi:hypothetical protein